MQITYLLVLFVGVVVLAAPSFADYYKGPKYVPKTPYSKPPQVEKPIPDIWIPKPPKGWFPKPTPTIPNFPMPKPKPKPKPVKKTPKSELPPLFMPPPPSRKPLPTPYRHYLGHPPVENAQYTKPNN